MSTTCGSCRQQYPAPETPAAPAPRYPEVVSDPLINAADTPGSVRRMTALGDPVLVKQVPGFALSSNVHAPDGPLRVTQANIGKYLVASSDPSQPQTMTDTRVEDRILDKWTVRDKAYWVDKPGKNAPLLFCVNNKYSMRQPFNPFASHQSKFPLFPRPDLCLGEQEGVQSTVKDYQPMVRPTEDGSSHRPSQDTNTCVNGQEEDGTSKLMCDCQPNVPCCLHKGHKSLAKCQLGPWENEVPFWWGGSPSVDGSLPVGDMDHYARIPYFVKDDTPQDLMKILLLDTDERYLPGQVYCSERRKIAGVGNWSYSPCRPPPPHLTKEQTSTGQASEERATCEERPWSIPPPRSSTVEKKDCRDVPEKATVKIQQKCRLCEERSSEESRMADLERNRCEELRKEQLFKVGQPFKSAACRWHHQLYPPQPTAVIGRTPTREFPHSRLTNI